MIGCTIHHRRGAALLCGMTLAASAAASPPAALATPRSPAPVGFQISPVGHSGFFRFDGRPGSVITGRLRVANTSARPRVLRLAAADMATADTGGVMYPGRPARAVGAWLTLDRGAVRLAPHASTVVTFRVRVPAGAAAGEHYAGILAVDAAEARAATAPSHRPGVAVRHLTRLAMPVRVDTPGRRNRRTALTGLAFGVDAGGPSLRIGLRNDGNAISRATSIQLEVTKSGRRLFPVDQHLGDVIPQTSIAFPARWQGRLQRGTYRVRGVIRPDHAAPIVVDQDVSFTPKLNRQLEHETGIAAAAPGGTSLVAELVVAASLAAAAIAGIAYLRLRRRLAAATSGRPRQP